MIGPTEELPYPLDYTTLYYRLGENLAGLYLDALNQLRWELHPQHTEDAAVVEGFWALFTQIVSNAETFSSRSNLNKRLEEFGQNLKLPLSEYEVAYAIEFMDIGSDSISIGPVTFAEPTKTPAVNWATETDRWDVGSSHKGLISAAYIRTSGSNHGRASESGLQQVSDAIDVIRVAALSGLAGRTANDELLQWQLTGAWSARKVDDSSARVLSGWSHRFRPRVMDIGPAIRAGLKRAPFDEIVSNALQPDIQRRLLRAVQWISGSVLHHDHAHKIVDLCTALEVMLLPNEVGRTKGDLIELRYNLLGGDLNPAGIRGFYNRRNDIVHGSALRAVGVLDTWQLRLECYSVLGRILALANDNLEVKTLQELIGGLETPKRLEEFIHRYDTKHYHGTGIGKIRSVAKSRLNKVLRD